jgi:capsular polysaccharide biosynthesis protein
MSPAPSTLAERLVRRWWMIVLPALALAAVGVVLGLARSPTWTAETQLSVGRTDVTAQANGGFALLANSISQVFSRIAYSDRAIAETSRRTGLSPDEIRDRITVTPLPNAPVFRLLATGDSAASATNLANAATRSTIDYIEGLNQRPGDQVHYLARYRAAAAQASALARRVRRLGTSNHSKSADAVRLALQDARLRASALGATYRQLVTTAGTSAGIAPLGTPARPSSDRSSFTQKAGVTGLLVGALIGLLLAVRTTRFRGLPENRSGRSGTSQTTASFDPFPPS